MRISRIIGLVFFLILSLGFTFAQVSIPVNKKELDDYDREMKIRAFLGIHMSVSSVHEIVEGKIGDEKQIVSRFYYNEAGLLERTNYYDSLGKKESFVIIKYDSENMAIEQIRFSADSILIDGSMYSYDENRLVKEIIKYKNPAVLVMTSKYERSKAYLKINHFDALNSLIFSEEFTFISFPIYEMPESVIKKDDNSRIFETINYSYNQENNLKKREIFGELAGKRITEFFYDSDGALVKTVNNNNKTQETVITDFIYDDYGNLITIKDKDNNGIILRAMQIDYFSRSSNTTIE